MENINKNQKIIIDNTTNIDFANWLMFYILCCLEEGGEIVIYKNQFNYFDVIDKESYLSLIENVNKLEVVYISSYIEKQEHNYITDELILDTTNKIIEDIRKVANIHINVEPNINEMKDFYIFSLIPPFSIIGGRITSIISITISLIISYLILLNFRKTFM